MGYAKHIGRVGALAVALGIGAAMATTPGIAYAQPDSTASSDSAAQSNADSPPSASEPQSPTSSAPTGPSGDGTSSEDDSTVTTEPAASGAQSTTVLGGGDGPTVVISGQSTGDADDADADESPEPTPVQQPAPEVAPASDTPRASRPAEAAADSAGSVIPNRHSAPTAAAPSAVGVDTTTAAPVATDAPAARVLATVLEDGPADHVGALPVSGLDQETALVTADPVPAPDPISSLLATPLSFVATAVNFMVGAFESIVGPGSPFDNPALWAVLAWARRQTNLGLANQSPVLTPQQTGQDLDDRQVHGTFGPADPDGDAVTYTVPESGEGAPVHGDVTIDQAARTWTYTPDAGYSGPDSFTVTASDEASGFHIHAPGQSHSVTATVNVTVAPPSDANHPPQQGDPGSQVDNVDQLSGVVTGHVNVTDPDDGDTITYALAAPIDPAIGTVEVNATTGAWTFTPEPQARLDAFTLQGDDEVNFTVIATDGHEAINVAATAPIDAAEAVETANIPVGGSPSTIAVSGDRAYVTNTGDGTVTVIDTKTNTVIDANPTTAAVDPIIVGSTPYGIAISGDRAYVVNQNDGTVSVIDTTTNTVVDTITVGGVPLLVAVSGDYAYVTNDGDADEGSAVTVIDTTTNTVVDTITVGDDPIGIAVNGDRAYVTNFEGTVYVIDTTTNTVIDTDLSTPDVDPIVVGNYPGGIAVSGDRVYVTSVVEGTVTVIDTTTNTVVETVSVGANPLGVAVSGDRIYVVNTGDGTVSVITSAHDGPELTPNEDGTFDMELHYGGDGEFQDVAIPAAGEPGAPSYWIVKEQRYNPETGVFEAVLEPTLAGQLLAGQGATLNDSFTLQATPANVAAPAAFSTFALRSAPAALAPPAPPGASAPLPQPPGATLDVVEDAVLVGDAPAGTVVTGKYAYIMNYTTAGTVTVIDADPTSPTRNTVITTIPVGDSPAVAVLAGDRLYVVNSAFSGTQPDPDAPATVTVIDTNTNTVIDADPSTPGIDPIHLGRSGIIPTASPDGTRVYVVNGLNGTVTVIDTDPNSQTYNTVVEVIEVAPAFDPQAGGYQLSGGTFSEDGTRFYVPRNHLFVVSTENGAQVVSEGDVMVIDTDPANTGTYNTVLDLDSATPELDGIRIDGIAPGMGAANGDRLYVPTWDYGAAQQYPAGSVTVIDIDPGSATFHRVVDADQSTPEVDGIPVGTLPLNMSVSPDGSVAYVVNAADGTVTVIDTVTNKAITTFTYDSSPSTFTGPNLLAISPDGKQMYITKFDEGAVTAVSIV